MDSRCHGDAVQETAEMCFCWWSDSMCVCMSVCVCVSVCVSLVPLREASVVDSYSTACRLWFSCGWPGPTFGTQRKYTHGARSAPALYGQAFLDQSVISVCVCVCVCVWVCVCVCVGSSPKQCGLLLAPNTLSFSGPAP